jgi:GH43 family beta-xylosidase
MDSTASNTTNFPDLAEAARVLDELQATPAPRPNRHDRLSMRRRWRSDGLPKVGFAWTDCQTRVVKYRATRKTKAQGHARRITRLAA